jgi:NAD-dependent SIR2 family protein deacetylase
MSKWNDSLIRELAERRVVIFIGAGISRAAHPVLPGWNDLLKQLSVNLSRKKDRALIEQLVNKGRLLDAAQIVTDGVQRAELSAKLRGIFQVSPVPKHALYEDLLKLDPKIIVTTNYDEFIEKNFEHFSNGEVPYNINRLRSKTLVNDLRSPMRTIVKVHGCVTDPTEVVLDRASYFNAKKDNIGLFATLSAIMTVNTILFVGYSIADPDIQLILENINMMTVSQHPHYALVEKFEHDSIKRAMSQTYNIDFIEYPLGGHQTVVEEIGKLREMVLESRTLRGIV